MCKKDVKISVGFVLNMFNKVEIIFGEKRDVAIKKNEVWTILGKDEKFSKKEFEDYLEKLDKEQNGKVEINAIG